MSNCADILDQRNQHAQYNIPPIRLKMVSPYGGQYNQFQLNMRRKVEILKYSGVNQNTKTNSQTKTAKWANIVSGQTSRRNVSQINIVQNTINESSACLADELIPTLTSGADVPGPVMTLFYDPKVPLYNYAGEANKRTYAIINKPDTSLWEIYTKNELNYLQSFAVSFTNDYAKNIETKLGVLIITDRIDVPAYTYSITTPIAIWCRGIHMGQNYNPVTKRTDPRTSHPNITLEIKDISLNVYYNGALVPFEKNGVVSEPVITLASEFTKMVINPNLTTEQVFYAIQYVGMVSISNINLTTQPGYIYDFKLQFDMDYVNPSITGFEAGVFCNLSSENQNVYGNPVTDKVRQNAILTSPNTTRPYAAGSFNQYPKTL